MPEIEITDDQREYLADLQDDLAERHVGAYGAVRPQDALQFLIDQYEDADAPAADGADEETDDDADDEEEAGEESDDDADDDGGADRLQAMMNLLDEHDDKWEEADSEEGRYAVTLPDGSTEQVRTQDDVRALLFQHYG